jgi:cob(I)alamin adenosyltransferase
VAAGGETIARLYTRTGDDGTTGLAHGARIGKDSARIEAYGTVDELGAHLGRLEANLPPGLAEFRPVLRRLQHQLFIAQAELAVGPGGKAPAQVLQPRHVTELEGEIDRFDAQHPDLRSFVLPGGSPFAAELHVTRTVARRAERGLWRLHRTEPVRPTLLQWVNRLSDLLFAMALAANSALGVAEVPPDYSV